MAHESFNPRNLPAIIRAAPRASRALMVLGLVGACALGVGAGLWARPGLTERRMIPDADRAARAEAAHRHQLEIVVNDAPSAPAPVAQAQPAVPSDPELAPEAADAPADATPRAAILAPADPAETPAPPTLTRVVAPPPAPAVTPAPAPDRKLQAVRAATERARVERVRIAQARIEQAQIAQAKADEAEAQVARLKAAKVQTAQLAAKAQKLRLAADHTKQAREDRLAEAAADRRAQRLGDARDAKAEAARTSAANRAQKARAARLAEIREADAQAAQDRRARAEKLQLAAKARKAADARLALAAARRQQAADELRQARAADLRRAKAASTSQPARLRLASASRCASGDPGANLVCADANLGAADRRMTEAYRQAEAAGVPGDRLQRQHQRWLAARTAAARDAPWAVQDIYQERIAELRDQARNAQGGY